MKLRLVGLLASLGFSASANPPGYAQESGTLQAQWRARCIYASEGVPLDFEKTPQEDGLQRRHIDAHGWPWEIDQQDFVSPGASARCPDWVLDRMAADWTRAEDCRFAYRHAAIALDRNGRAGEALRLLAQSLAEAQDPTSGLTRKRVDFFSELGARLAARAQRWDLALELAETWLPDSTCGMAWLGDELIRTRFRAECLLAADRHAELRALAPRQLASVPCAALVECWLTSELEEGRARDFDAALASILVQAPVERQDTCRAAAESWQLARAPRDQQWQALDELAREHPALAMALLLDSQPSAIAERMDAFEIDGEWFREPALASLLIELGLPAVAPALEQAKAQLKELGTEHQVNSSIATWNTANERWLLLTEW